MLSWALNALNRDVRDVCGAIESLRKELDSLDSPQRVVVGDAFDLAKSRAQSSPAECRQLLDEVGRRDVAAYLVYHAAGDLVASGNYHVYRGLLNSTGFELKRLYDICVSRLVESGRFSEETRLSSERTLSDDIKRAG